MNWIYVYLVSKLSNFGLTDTLQLFLNPKTYFIHSIVYVRVRSNKRPLLIPVSLNFTYFARIPLFRIDSPKDASHS